MGSRICILAAGLLILGTSDFAEAAGQPGDNSLAAPVLEIKTIDLMLAEVEAQPLDDSDKREEANKTIDGLFVRMVPIFTRETVDNVDLWKLAARYELARQKLGRSYINTATPMFHIARLLPEYTKDEATLALMAKLNRFADTTRCTEAEAGFRDFMAAFGKDLADPHVQYSIAENYRAAKGLLYPNHKEAAEWYEKAARAGHADAAAHLGAMLLERHNLGVEQDETRGIALLRQASEDGSGVGAYELGFAYALGKGVARDRDRSVELYQLALQRGNEGPALFALMHGSTGQEAVRYAQLATQKGYLTAYFVLGQWYLYGQNVESAPERAIEVLENGAKAESDSCAVLLAAVYRVGYGVEKDLAAASKWESIATKLGADSASLKETTDRLEHRSQMAESLGKNTINEDEYRAGLQKLLDGLKKK